MFVTRTVPTPVGDLRLVADDTALVGVWFPDHRGAPPIDAATVVEHPILDQAEAELSAYFAGARRSFSVPTRADGTPFQRAVWAELARIPYGETRTYAQIAVAVGRPGATRAVGTANGANPLSILVPCHRVVATGGAISGYAGGVDKKRWLLGWEANEGAIAGRPPAPALFPAHR